jgi:protein-disulfide isomerase
VSKRGSQRDASRLIRQQKAIEARRKRSVRISAIVAGVLVAVSVGAYVVYANTRPTTHNVPQQANAAGTGIVAGSGPVKVDVYQDYLCPSCQAFHTAAEARLQTMVQENKITLTTHPIAILDRLSTNRYSTRSAAAAGCAADGGKFAPFSDALYAKQPAEGGAGYTDDELVNMGRSAGLGDAFATCVRDGTYAGWPAFVTDESSSRGVTGTPTIFVNDKKVVPAQGQTITDAVFSAIAGQG